MPKAEVFDTKGNKIKKINLPAEIFDVEIKPEVVHFVVSLMRSNQHYNWAHTKDRSEVRGGGRKPWRQKGTGRARHGSIRSPIFKGGGVTFGPRKEKKYFKKINKKLRRKVLFMCLTDRLKEDKIKIVDKLKIDNFKTKKALEILKNLKLDDKKVLIVKEEKDDKIRYSFNNLKNTGYILANSINPLEILKYEYLLLTEPSIEKIKETFL